MQSSKLVSRFASEYGTWIMCGRHEEICVGHWCRLTWGNTNSLLKLTWNGTRVHWEWTQLHIDVSIVPAPCTAQSWGKKNQSNKYTKSQCKAKARNVGPKTHGRSRRERGKQFWKKLDVQAQRSRFLRIARFNRNGRLCTDASVSSLFPCFHRVVHHMHRGRKETPLWHQTDVFCTLCLRIGVGEPPTPHDHNNNYFQFYFNRNTSSLNPFRSKTFSQIIAVKRLLCGGNRQKPNTDIKAIACAALKDWKVCPIWIFSDEDWNETLQQ